MLQYESIEAAHRAASLQKQLQNLLYLLICYIIKCFTLSMVTVDLKPIVISVPDSVPEIQFPEPWIMIPSTHQHAHVHSHLIIDCPCIIYGHTKHSFTMK